MNRNAFNTVLLASASVLSLFGAACAEPKNQPWAMRTIARDYTFAVRDDEGAVVVEGRTVQASELNKGRLAYVHYCYACHGMNGDGRGPASIGLRPSPRDFRMAAYKFDTVSEGLPNDIDFKRIIKGGLHGTAMLKWDITSVELDQVIQFIKTFPKAPCNAFVDVSPECVDKLEHYPDSSLEEKLGSVFEDTIVKLKPSEAKLGLQVGQPKPTGEPVVKQHYDENDDVVVDAPADPWLGKDAEAVKTGEELYHFKFECTTCHAHYLTRKAIYDYKVAREPQAVVSYRTAMFYAVPQPNAVPLFGVATMPPDFTMNPIRSMRAGSELPDLYRLIAAGVGVMPTWAQAAKPEELWALAHYVKSLAELRSPANTGKRDALKATLHGDNFVPPPPPKKEEPAVTDEGAGGGDAAEKKDGEASTGADAKVDAKKADDKKGDDKKTDKKAAKKGVK